jgi:hypothetical protein
MWRVRGRCWRSCPGVICRPGLSAACQQAGLTRPRDPSRTKATPRRWPAVWWCSGRSCKGQCAWADSFTRQRSQVRYLSRPLPVSAGQQPGHLPTGGPDARLASSGSKRAASAHKSRALHDSAGNIAALTCRRHEGRVDCCRRMSRTLPRRARLRVARTPVARSPWMTKSMEDIRWLVARHAEALHGDLNEEVAPSPTNFRQSTEKDALASDASTGLRPDVRGFKSVDTSRVMANWKPPWPLRPFQPIKSIQQGSGRSPDGSTSCSAMRNGCELPFPT